MKSIPNLYLVPVLFCAWNAHSQEADTVKVLPVDPETNCQLRYCYYPNLEAYFDRQTNLYIYKDKGGWIQKAEIPSGYRGYGLFNRANVELTDYDDENPMQFLDAHRKKYPYNSLRKTRASLASAH